MLLWVIILGKFVCSAITVYVVWTVFKGQRPRQVSCHLHPPPHETIPEMNKKTRKRLSQSRSEARGIRCTAIKCGSVGVVRRTGDCLICVTIDYSEDDINCQQHLLLKQKRIVRSLNMSAEAKVNCRGFEYLKNIRYIASTVEVTQHQPRMPVSVDWYGNVRKDRTRTEAKMPLLESIPSAHESSHKKIWTVSHCVKQYAQSNVFGEV